MRLLYDSLNAIDYTVNYGFSDPVSNMSDISCPSTDDNPYMGNGYFGYMPTEYAISFLVGMDGPSVRFGSAYKFTSSSRCTLSDYEHVYILNIDYCLEEKYLS